MRRRCVPPLKLLHTTPRPNEYRPKAYILCKQQQNTMADGHDCSFCESNTSDFAMASADERRAPVPPMRLDDCRLYRSSISSGILCHELEVREGTHRETLQRVSPIVAQENHGRRDSSWRGRHGSGRRSSYSQELSQKIVVLCGAVGTDQR